MASVSWINDFEFEITLRGETIIKGFIPEEKIENFPRDFIERANTTLKILGIDLEERKKRILSYVEPQDLANFLFIRAIFDYGGVTPSMVIEDKMLDLYKERKFLFRPNDERWSKVTDRIMELILLPIAGLLRTKFENIAKWWKNIITFLNKKCEGDASNFFIKLSKEYNINIQDPRSLEELHLRLVNRRKKEFPYGDKNGRLMVALMSNSKRGFGVLKGVKSKHLRHFDLPVNSQVIRLSLNSGLIKILDVKSEEYSSGKGKEIKRGRGLKLTQDIKKGLVMVCKKLWRVIANKLKIFPVDLDIYVWSLGAIICKRFGKFCSLCPLNEICDSVKRGYVGESRGVDWYRGCFTLGKPQLNTIPIIRVCKDCPDFDPQRRKCKRDKNYAVRMMSKEEIKMLEKILSSSKES